MIREYKAFISYRHLPLEMAIAKKLHKRIEHFRIPRKLAKGKSRKPGYVFRDQDELPLSNNLTKNIQEALDHSEFLIVICSPHTRESAWVLREISYFLEHHDHNHVLVVLADGTPEESFPKQIVEYTHPDGSVERIEPIAADLVANTARERNRRLQTESLRILAALIGCTYDELYRREHRYRMMRLGYAAAGVLAVAAVYVGMLLNRNAAILENYRKALQNQSSYLASESKKFAESGDRLSAIYLALEALPSERNERPRVSAAEYALNSALGLYRAPSDFLGKEAVGAFSHNSNVEDFALSEDESVLCSLTADNLITCWDTSAFRRIWEYQLEDESVAWIAGFAQDGLFVAGTEDRIVCLKLETGEKQWEAFIAEYTQKEWDSICSVRISDSNADVYVATYDSILRFDHITGNVVSTVAAEHPDFVWETSVISSERAEFSDDGEYLAVQFNSDKDYRGVVVYSSGTGKIVCRSEGTPPHYNVCSGVAFSEDMQLYYSAHDSSRTAGFNLGSSSYMTNTSNYVYCLDMKTGEITWETEFISSMASANERLYLVQTDDSDVLLYAYANHLAVIDPASGKTAGEAEFASRIVNVDYYNNAAVCTMEGGQYGIISTDRPQSWISRPDFVTNIRLGKNFPGSFWVLQKESSKIIHYVPFMSDPAWMQYRIESPESFDNLGYGEEQYAADGCAAILGGHTLLVSDGTPEASLREIRLPDGEDYWSRYRYSIEGKIRDELVLSWGNSYESGAVYVNIKTGEIHAETWDKPGSFLLTMEISDGTDDIYWHAVTWRDTETEEGTEEHNLFASSLSRELEVRKESEIAVVPAEVNTVEFTEGNCDYCFLMFPEIHEAYMTDFQNGKSVLLSKALGEAIHISFDNGYADNVLFSPLNEKTAVWTGENEITIMSKDSIAGIISGERQRILSAVFTPDGEQILTVESDLVLRRYAASSGQLLGKTDLIASSYFEGDSITWEFSDHGFLIVNIGSVANLVSMEDWGVISFISGYLGYQQERDVFCARGTKNSETIIGEFPRRSVEECVMLGKAALRDFEWSEEQRIQYGLW